MCHGCHAFLYVSCFFVFLISALPPRSTLSLHDALPISRCRPRLWSESSINCIPRRSVGPSPAARNAIDREIGRATSELQSLRHLVCRLLLEKKKKNNTIIL